MQDLKKEFQGVDLFPNKNSFNLLMGKFEQIFIEDKIPEQEMGEDGIYNTKCDTIFAIYLYALSQKVQPHIWKEVFVFIYVLREALNENSFAIPKYYL